MHFLTLLMGTLKGNCHLQNALVIRVKSWISCFQTAPSKPCLGLPGRCCHYIDYFYHFSFYFVNSRVSVPSKVLIYTGSLMPTADMRFPLIFSAQFSPRTEEDLSNRNLPQNLKGERFKVCKPGISDKRCHF